MFFQAAAHLRAYVCFFNSLTLAPVLYHRQLPLKYGITAGLVHNGKCRYVQAS